MEKLLYKLIAKNNDVIKVFYEDECEFVYYEKNSSNILAISKNDDCLSIVNLFDIKKISYVSQYFIDNFIKTVNDDELTENELCLINYINRKRGYYCNGK